MARARVIRSSATDPKIVDSDQAKPVEIEHRCEELFAGGQLIEKYNFFVYHFEQKGRYFWAKAYKDEISTVSIFGPFERRGSREPLSGPIDDDILAYFRRRFRKVERFSEGRYVPI